MLGLTPLIAIGLTILFRQYVYEFDRDGLPTWTIDNILLFLAISAIIGIGFFIRWPRTIGQWDFRFVARFFIILVFLGILWILYLLA